MTISYLLLSIGNPSLIKIAIHILKVTSCFKKITENITTIKGVKAAILWASARLKYLKAKTKHPESQAKQLTQTGEGRASVMRAEREGASRSTRDGGLLRFGVARRSEAFWCHRREHRARLRQSEPGRIGQRRGRGPGVAESPRVRHDVVVDGASRLAGACVGT